MTSKISVKHERVPVRCNSEGGIISIGAFIASVAAAPIETVMQSERNIEFKIQSGGFITN